MMTWHPLDGVFQRLDYASYEAYLAHQRAKLQRMDQAKLDAYEQRFLEALVPRLATARFAPGTRVLCLGARRGTEVRAFLALGCTARGVDVNPGAGNRYVQPGDFHHLPDGTGTLDVVFTNALDHCYDFDRLLKEIRRVLVPQGEFRLEAVRGTDEGCPPGAYESFTWPTIDALVEAVVAHGFRCTARLPFTCPWPGEHLVCRRTDA